MKLIFTLLNIFLLTFMANLALASQKPINPKMEIKKTADNIILIAPTSGYWSNFGHNALQGAELALENLENIFKLTVINENQNNIYFNNPSLAETTIIVGHLFEGQLANNAQSYLLKNKTIILPFISEDKILEFESNNFFTMMPSHKLQGEFLALEILKERKRADKFLIISDDILDNKNFVNNFLKILKNPLANLEENQETEIEALETEQNKKAKGAKAKTTSKIPKALDEKALIVHKTIDNINNFEVKEFETDTPNYIILAVSKENALNLAVWIKKQNYKNFELVTPSSLASRKVGATFLNFNISAKFILPINLNSPNKNISEFKNKYLSKYKQEATWVSALTYDSMAICIKAISLANNTLNTQEAIDIISYLSATEKTHQELANYSLIKNKTLKAPVTFMKLTNKTLAYLP